MKNIYYVATPISELPPLPKHNRPVRYTVFHCDYPSSMWQSIYHSRSDGSTYWNEDREPTMAPESTFTHWLKPCTETGAGEFAELIRREAVAFYKWMKNEKPSHMDMPQAFPDADDYYDIYQANKTK